MLYKVLIIYLICFSLISALVTILDKVAAIKGKWRVSEKALILLSVFGGSIAMIFTMLLIHHKTRKPLFMVGIPIIIFLQLAIVIFIMVNI